MIFFHKFVIYQKLLHHVFRTKNLKNFLGRSGLVGILKSTKRYDYVAAEEQIDITVPKWYRSTVCVYS